MQIEDKVFISYSIADMEWVYSYLIPKFELNNINYIDEKTFEVGVPRIVNIERAIEQSRHVLIVLTPDWLKSDWSEFVAVLTQTIDPTFRQHKLLPILLKPSY